MPAEWTCEDCGYASVPAAAVCQRCMRPRFASFAIMVATHVLELLADGESDPLPILEALQSRPCYADKELSLAFIAQQMRLLTKDTTALARQIAKARASRVMLDVLETGDTKDKIAVLKGIQVLGDVIEHKVDAVTRHVVELHEGPAPKGGE